MDTPIEAKLAENIHDYLDEIRDLVENCEARLKFPHQAIESRSLILQELPRIIDSVEALTQTLVKTLKTHQDVQVRLDAIRCLEKIDFSFLEHVPRAKKDLINE